MDAGMMKIVVLMNFARTIFVRTLAPMTSIPVGQMHYVQQWKEKHSVLVLMVLYQILLPILVAFEHQRCSVACTRIAQLAGDARTIAAGPPVRLMVLSACRANGAMLESVGTHAILTINALTMKYARVGFVSLDVKEILSALIIWLVNQDSAVILALNLPHVALTPYARQKTTTPYVVVHHH